MSIDDKNPEPDSNVWASYSDLFTNVAIIFLVMFVFALIKATMSQVKNVQTKKQHENELKGKLSSKDVQKSKQRIAEVEKTVNEMKSYEEVIDQKVWELNEYAKKLQANKKILKEVIESQSKQDSIIKAAEEKVQEQLEINKQKESDLEASKIKIALLNEQLERAQLEVKQREDIYLKQEKSKSEIAKKNEMELKKTIADLHHNLSVTQKEAATLSAELKKEQDQTTTITKLNQQLKQLESELEMNKNSSNQLHSEKNALGQNVKKLSEHNASLKKEYDQLYARFTGADQSAQEMTKKIAYLSDKLSQNESDAGKWKKEFEKKFGEAEKLQNDLNEAQRRFQSLARTLKDLKDTVKNDVAMKLQDKFKENGLDAKINLKTGEVILLSGEGFNFEKGSAKLSVEAKKILKKLIPVYANVLMGDEKVFKQISSISMEGHSSPSFSGKYVNPEDPMAEAYSYNMRLSAMRAAAVANYLMASEIGDYPHKNRIKNLLQSVGFGYMKPIPTEIQRLPASSTMEAQDCGPWDCHKSQRVQINFHLKDNMEEIHKIIDSNGGIK